MPSHASFPTRLALPFALAALLVWPVLPAPPTTMVAGPGDRAIASESLAEGAHRADFGGPAALVAQAVPATHETGTADGLGFYRDPSLHDGTLVFEAEGDLWTVGVEGGVARRLTTHPDRESDPVLSPDGRVLAFTARYEGPAELYTMPVDGGAPTRWSYEPESSIATTWTPDGRLVYTTSAHSTLPRPQLVVVDPADGSRSRVPLAEATEAAYDDTGRSLFFVRPPFHNNVTKRYTGGTARDVWRFDEGADEAVELTGDYDGESHSPMWWDGRVYFVSDRDGTMNLWSMTPAGGDARQHTGHAGFDLRSPSLSEGRIAYDLAGDLWIYDIAADATRRVPIALASDFDHLRETWVEEPMDYLTSAHLHPEGESVVLTARGRVFVAPVGDGRIARASRETGVRYRDVTFLPGGERLLGLSDASGELEWITLPADGVGEEEAITSDGDILRFEVVPSPDGTWFAYTDNNRDLWVRRTDGSDARRINEHREGADDLAWSPDGRWLAYSRSALNTFDQIRLYDTESGQTLTVTSDRVNSVSPAWSADGEHLFFLSDRDLDSRVGSPWGSRQPEPFFDEEWELYVVALREGGDTPFRAPDELTVEGERTGDDSDGNGGASGGATDRRSQGAGSGDAQTVPDVVVDAAGLTERVWKIPVESGNHRQLTATDDALFWIQSGPAGVSGSELKALPITDDEAEPVTVAENVGSYELSMDREKIMVRRGSSIFVVDARVGSVDLDEGEVDLDGWRFTIVPHDDWRQLFVDAWRLERDYFYDPGMHGVDWEAVRDRYLPLVERVTTRDELSDVIGQAVGELSALHTSVRGGDLREGPTDIGIGSLGARTVRDAAAGGYRIEYIYRHDPDYPDTRSPLADPAHGIELGDVIVAVNGQPTLEARDLGAMLRNQAGEPVRLTLRRGDAGDGDGDARNAGSGSAGRTGDVSAGGAYERVVEAMGSDRDLRYTDWEVTRRERVEEASDGRVGYVHLRAMGGGDIDAWYEQFYPVFDRQGLIVDVRSNNGGNIDSFILEKLMRTAWMYWKNRVMQNEWNMQYAFRGHMVVLVDQETASDGEAFAEGFRRLGLGPVIGARTWGGEIWLSSSNRLSDGGLARAPMDGVFGPEGEWLIEQVGVIPDVVVDNLPHATFEGTDAQLDAAIDHLLRRIAEDPRSVPIAPPYPDRSFDYPPPGTNGAAGGGAATGGGSGGG